MCERTKTPPSLVCTIGDLKPGQQYHDPNGETWMVLDPSSAIRDLESCGGDCYVVNIGNRRGGSSYNTFGNALNDDELAGIVTPVRGDTRLGYDRDGRLYASTYLNDWYYYIPYPSEAQAILEEAVALPLEVLPPPAADDYDETTTLELPPPPTTTMGDV